MRNAGEWFFALVQRNVLTHQVAIGDASVFRQLLFPPTIEPVTHARLFRETGRYLLRLGMDEGLCLFVARIIDNRQIEGKPNFEILYTRLFEASLRRCIE